MEKRMNKWWVIATVCLLTVMLNIDATAVNLAIPVMAHDLSASLADMQWVLVAFTLVSAMFQILGGRFGDAYGHRKFFLVGTFLFVISSLLAGVAVNESMLISARALQGLALGLAFPSTLAMAYDVFPEEQHGLVMGVAVGAMGVALALGPSIGGFILYYLNWRWIFLVNLPIGLLTIMLTFIFCPKDKKRSEHQPFDLVGGILLLIALLCIILPLNEMQSWGILSTRFLSVLAVGLVAGIILFFVEKNKSHPVIDFDLFKIYNFSLNNVTRVCAQLIFIPVLFFVPIYLQNISGFNEMRAGVIMLALTVVIGLLSPIAGRFVDRIGPKAPTATSMLLFAFGGGLLSCLHADPNMWLLIPALLLVGIASGINFVSTTAGALAQIPSHQSGLATGVFFTVVWGSCALAVAVMGSILAMASSHHLTAQLLAQHLHLKTAVLEQVERVAHGVSSLTQLHPLFSGTHLTTITKITTDSFMQGFRVSMWVLTGFGLFGFFASFLEKHVSVSTSHS